MNRKFIWSAAGALALSGASILGLVVSAQEVPSRTPDRKISQQPAALAEQKKKTLDEVTFYRDVAPIMYNKCSTCHHEGSVAPFKLMSFEDAAKRAPLIDAVVSARYMPPWKPASGFGQFKDCKALAPEEIDTIKRWVAQGAPAGNKSDSPSVPKFSSEWRLGTPDLVVKMPEPFKVPAGGPDIYRCFVLPLDISEHKFVTAVEFKPSNPKVVHHCLFFLDASGAARKRDQEDKGPGFASFGGPGFVPTGGLGGWAPGNAPGHLENGVARVIRAKSDLVIQEHFHPSGKEELEQSTIGIYFSKEPPKKLLVPCVVRSRKIDIPAGANEYKVHASTTLPIDMQAVNIVPHAHLLCRQIKAEAITPQGEKLPIIWIKNWDFNWQDQYTFKSPIKLPAGSRIEAEFTYDNSANNPKNPSQPPKRVTWGEQTTDEMAMLFMGVTADRQDELPKYFRAMLMQNVTMIVNVNPFQWKYLLKRMANPLPVPLSALDRSDEQPKSGAAVRGSGGAKPGKSDAVLRPADVKTEGTGDAVHRSGGAKPGKNDAVLRPADVKIEGAGDAVHRSGGAKPGKSDAVLRPADAKTEGTGDAVHRSGGAKTEGTAESLYRSVGAKTEGRGDAMGRPGEIGKDAI